MPTPSWAAHSGASRWCRRLRSSRAGPGLRRLSHSGLEPPSCSTTVNQPNAQGHRQSARLCKEVPAVCYSMGDGGGGVWGGGNRQGAKPPGEDVCFPDGPAQAVRRAGQHLARFSRGRHGGTLRHVTPPPPLPSSARETPSLLSSVGVTGRDVLKTMCRCTGARAIFSSFALLANLVK